MASTYSKLKIELIGTGDQAGQWGTTTNNNLGSSSAGVYRGLEQAIVGMATISSGFVANSYTLPYTDSNDDQEFRCLVLNITASLSNPSDLIVPAIQKPYIVINSSGQTVTVKVSGQTGVAVPNGAKILLYNTGTGVGTDITSAITYLTELKLGGNLTMPSAGSINDSNGNELIKFPSAVASAVNELTISNAATGSAPTLSATGGDTNIGITLTPKGTGVVTISNLAATTIDTTNIEVTNIKAKDGTAAASIADSTGVITSVKDQVINGLTVGRGAGAVSTNTAVGASALNANTTGGRNTAVGRNALLTSTTPSDNSAFGDSALGSNTTGAQNSAVGRTSLLGNTTGSSNAGFGYESLYTNSSGNYNTAIGNSSLYSNTTASNNTAVGYQALYNSTGADNTSLGYQAGDVITTGTGNVIIGKGADPSVNSATDQIVIGNGVTGQANTNVTIGNGTGKIYNAYTVNATWTQTSDGTMKNVIGPDSLGLSFINRLNPILFTWKAQNDLPPDHPYYAEENKRDTTRVIHGFVAQEVKAALDAEGCSTFNGWDQGDDGIQAISREMFISPLVKAVQELSAQVDQLKAELATLKGA